VANHPVLAARIEGLEDDQHTVGVLGSQPCLVLAEELDALREELPAFFLGSDPRLGGGIETLRQDHPRTRLDPQPLHELSDSRFPIGHHTLSSHHRNRRMLSASNVSSSGALLVTC
jgi:hypothetical protein